MAIPIIAWGVGLALLMMGGDAPPKKKQDEGGGTGGGPNSAPPEAAPFITRIQRCLLAMGLTGDGELKINGRLDISTQLALQEYWKRSGGFTPLSYAQLAVRLEAELAGKPAPSLNPTPTAEVLARIQAALAKLGFNNATDYYLAKGEFPPDNTPTGWALMLGQLESAAGITKSPANNIKSSFR